MRLDNFSLASVTGGEDGLFFNVTLTERQRVNSIAISGTPGGDGANALLELRAGLFQDIGTNPSPACQCAYAQRNCGYHSPGDSFRIIHYGLFTLTFTASEIIDTTPASRIDLSKLRLAKFGGATGADAFDLSGLKVTEADEYTVTITLDEARRIQAMRWSAVDGGDGLGTPTVLDLDTGSVFDIGRNTLAAEQTIVLSEFADEDPPLILGATVNYSTGILIIESQETLSLSSRDDLQNVSRILLRNISGNDPTVRLSGAKFVAVDALQMTLTLTELQRVTAIALSSTPGGDGTAMVLDLEEGATADVRGNINADAFGITISEASDIILPELQGAELSLETAS